MQSPVTTSAPAVSAPCTVWKNVSICDVSGALRKKAVDALGIEFALEIGKARHEEDPESDSDIAAGLTVRITYDHIEYRFDTDGLFFDPRYDKVGRIDRVVVHRVSRNGDFSLLDTVDVQKRTAASEPAPKKRRMIAVEIGKGGKAMYEVFE